MNRNKTFLLQAALTLGATLLAVSSRAVTSIAMVGGGSSAMQGDYRADANYGPGAIPQAIERLNTITGYKVAGQDDRNNILVCAGMTAVSTQGTAITETINDAMIRYIKVGTNDYRIIVLARSDAGLGVRYVANRMRITSLGTVKRVFRDQSTGAATGFSATITGAGSITGTDQTIHVTQDDVNVINFVNGQLPLDIDTGFNDLSADSIARYANTASVAPNGTTQAPFGLFVPGLANLQVSKLPVITLLPLYNVGIHNVTSDFPLNVTRDQMFKVLTGQPVSDVDGNARPIQWSDLDPRFGATTTPVIGIYREKFSGTRNSALALFLRKSLNKFYTENFFGNGLDPVAQGLTGANPTPQVGTGRMLQTLNIAIPNADALTKGVPLGYSFVTGIAGNNRPNIRVAQFNGVAAYRRSPATDTVPITTGASISLPGNNGQPSYTAGTTNGTYYTETANGRYDLWTAGAFLTRSDKPTQFLTASSLANTLDSADSVVQGVVNSLGFTQFRQMSVTRVGFTSALTGEFVTDAQSITYDLSGLYVADTDGIIN